MNEFLLNIYIDHSVKWFLIIQESIYVSNEFFTRYDLKKYCISNLRFTLNWTKNDSYANTNSLSYCKPGINRYWVRDDFKNKTKYFMLWQSDCYALWILLVLSKCPLLLSLNEPTSVGPNSKIWSNTAYWIEH